DPALQPGEHHGAPGATERGPGGDQPASGGVRRRADGHAAGGKMKKLDKIAQEATGYVFESAMQLAIEKIAEDIAKEALADESFKAALRALVQKHSKTILESLT